MIRSLRSLLPSRESLRSNPSLRWLGPLLNRAWLWQFNRRRVAAGIGIGVFFGFLIPVMQIAFAAVFALILRANLPAAVVSTLVSNPFTYAPIFVAAYRVGKLLLGEPADDAQAEAIGAGAEQLEVLAHSWWDSFTTIGKPLMVGLAVFAVVGGLLAYFGTLLAWRVVVALRRRRRHAGANGN
ncbi:MAG: DUF2062 domain-containing protein [Burkholderiales bacterium]